MDPNSGDFFLCWSYLRQQVKICHAVANIRGEVGNLPATARVPQVVVHPSQQDLFRGELEEIFKTLTFFK